MDTMEAIVAKVPFLPFFPFFGHPAVFFNELL
jgi:hypothetical protein